MSRRGNYQLFPTDLARISLHNRAHELGQDIELLLGHVTKGSDDQVVTCDSIAQGNSSDGLIGLEVLNLYRSLNYLTISMLQEEV